MQIRRAFLALLLPAMLAVGAPACASQSEEVARAELGVRLRQAQERLGPHSPQRELDAFAYLLMDLEGLDYNQKLSGEAASAIAVAYNEFLARGLKRDEGEMAHRLVSVAEAISDNKRYFIVDFRPRYVPVEQIPVSPDYTWDRPHWFYPVETYRFYIRAETLEFERYETVPQ